MGRKETLKEGEWTRGFSFRRKSDLEDERGARGLFMCVDIPLE